jgi:hypothetical protein
MININFPEKWDENFIEKLKNDLNVNLNKTPLDNPSVVDKLTVVELGNINYS